MRKQVHDYVSACPECRLNNFPKTNAEKTGFMLATEPNVVWAIDVAGPLRGWASSSTSSASGAGAARYIFVAVDLFSRFLVTSVMKDVTDDSVFKSLLHLREMLNGFPRRIQCDGALLTKKSNSLKFLREHGVDVRHGQANVSRDQSNVERAISTLTRLYSKLHTECPQTPFPTLISEATLTYNSAPSDSLPNGFAPKDVFYARAPSNFLRSAADEPEVKAPKTIREVFQSSRAAGHAVLKNAVCQYIRRKQEESSTRPPRVKIGEFALKKRTVFPTSAPKKLAHRCTIEAFEVMARVATNSFRCVSLVDGSTKIIPGDFLIRLRGFDRARTLSLLEAMAAAHERCAAPRAKRILRPRTIQSASSFVQVHIDNGDRLSAEAFCLEDSFLSD